MRSILILIFTLLASSNLAAKECLSWRADFSTLNNLVVGDINIVNDDIFKTEERKKYRLLHLTANKLHITTKSSVIQQQLLFRKGDKFNLEKLQESERLLRKNRYIKDATIHPAKLCGRTVTILVETQDNWTLTPGLSLGSSGGKNRSGISLQEHNLFGLGKSIALKYKKNSARSSILLAYKDSHLLGSRKQLSASIQDNSDGKGYALALNQPFYATDSKYSWGLNASSIKQQNAFYHQGTSIKKVGVKKDAHSVFYGWVNDTPNKRFKVGWTYNKHHYFQTKTDNNAPQNITESYPWLEIERYKQRYIKKTNFRTMDRTEDIELGKRLSFNFGLLSSQLGSDDNYLRLSTKLSKGIEINQDNLGFLGLEATSYLGKGQLKGSRISAQGEWYTFNKTGNSLYFGAKASVTNNLLYGEQTVLGGETGLRGYPLGYQTGNKSLLLTAEKRFHFDWYPLKIAKFGAVVFTDVGSAWGKGEKAKVLADVGIGLRIVPTRSSSAKIFHFDLSFPLVDRKKVDHYQIIIKTSYSF